MGTSAPLTGGNRVLGNRPSCGTIGGMDSDERQLAVDLFNATWTLLDKPDRTASEDARLMHTAHASAYHWSQVGQPVNLARGEWQVSRVYAVLGLPESARWHAQRCYDLCVLHDLGDWDLAFAHEALARAYATAGEPELARRHVAAAGEVSIAEDEDRNLLQADLATIPVQR
jgi:hypothetical protein